MVASEQEWVVDFGFVEEDVGVGVCRDGYWIFARHTLRLCREYTDLLQVSTTTFCCRYYDPQTGQFLSVDPLVDDGVALAATPRQDPVNNYDLSGTCSASAMAGRRGPDSKTERRRFLVQRPAM